MLHMINSWRQHDLDLPPIRTGGPAAARALTAMACAMLTASGGSHLHWLRPVTTCLFPASAGNHGGILVDVHKARPHNIKQLHCMAPDSRCQAACNRVWPSSQHLSVLFFVCRCPSPTYGVRRWCPSLPTGALGWMWSVRAGLGRPARAPGFAACQPLLCRPCCAVPAARLLPADCGLLPDCLQGTSSWRRAACRPISRPQSWLPSWRQGRPCMWALGELPAHTSGPA